MKLSSAVQESLIALLCYDDSPQSKAIRAMVSVKSYDPFFRELAQAADEYIARYHQPPGEHTFDLVEALGERRPDDKEVFERIYHSILQTKDSINRDYILARAGYFVRNQRMKGTIAEAIKVLQTESETAVDQAEALFSNLNKNVSDLTSSGLLLNDPNQALSFLDTIDEEVMPMGVSELDKLNLGPARKQLWMLIAATNKGKTWCAVHKGKTALRFGKRVLHITLEMSEAKVAQRYIHSLFAVSKREVKNLTLRHFQKDDLGRFLRIEEFAAKKRPHLLQSNIRKVLLKKLKYLKHRPKLIIKQFPTGALTIAQLKGYLDHLEGVHNFLPDLCIAEGSLVLTDRGLVHIESVKLEDRVWDGLNWVCHKGVVCKGEKNVITYNGLTATPDHEVWTQTGWRTLITCSRLGLPIAQTGIGRKEIRFGENYIREGSGQDRSLSRWKSNQDDLCSSSLFQMRNQEMDFAVESAKWNCGGLPKLPSTQKVSKVVLCSSPSGERSLHQQKKTRLEKLWWAGDRIPLFIGRRGLLVDNEEFRGMEKSETPIGSNRQRRALRTWQSQNVHSQTELRSYYSKGVPSENSSIQTTPSENSLHPRNFGYLLKQAENGPKRGGSEMEKQGERKKVYDILDAGPLHRFTVQGLLVHNCILDYVDLMEVDPKNKRNELGKLYVDMRGLAVERNIAVATYSQSNRLGMSSKLLDLGKIAEDISKTHTADTVITFNQTDAEQELGLARLFVAKAREEVKHMQVLISQSYGIGQFCIDSAMMETSRYWRLIDEEDDKGSSEESEDDDE